MINEPTGQDQIIVEPTRQRWKTVGAVAFTLSLAIWLARPTLTQWLDGVKSVDAAKIISAEVFKGTLIRDVAVTGKLVAANAPTLYSSESGQITLLAKPGDSVIENDIVATLASPELMAKIAQQQAKLASLKINANRGLLVDSEAQLDLERRLDTAKLRLNASKRELRRAMLSYQKQVISELDFVTVQDAKIEADLLYRHAEKRVELAKKRLNFENQTREFAVKSQQLVLNELHRRQQLLAIRAPVAGVIGSWLAQQKEQVAKSQAILTVVDLSEYQAQLMVPEFYADDLGIGLTVNLNIGGNVFVGTISSVSPEVKSNQVMVRVNVVPDATVKLRQNQRLNARIEFEKKTDVLMVKRGAFLTSGAGQSAFVINDDQLARVQAISIGSQSVEFIEITSGLRTGDRIITSDYSEFQQYQTIKIRQ